MSQTTMERLPLAGAALVAAIKKHSALDVQQWMILHFGVRTLSKLPDHREDQFVAELQKRFPV